MKRLPYARILLIWLLVLIVVTAALVLVDIPVAKTGDVAGFLAYVDEFVPRYLERRHISGAAVGLVHKGQIVHLAGYGYADADRQVPVTEDTVFQVASISKSVTAWSVMRLVEEGRIDLDVPVSTYLTRWKLPPSEYDARGVTVRRLLSHSAGIANVGGYAGFDSRGEVQTLEDSLVSAQDAGGEGARIIYRPGSKYLYSGGGYTILQLLVEEVTQQPFATYMENEILGPLNMTHSSFGPSSTIEQDLSVVYDTDGNVAPSRFFAAKAAAGLHTTARDLTTWVMAAMPSDAAPQGGGVLQPETLQEMFLPQPRLSERLPYGLGYRVQRTGTGELEVSHTGSNLPGWYSLAAALPGKGEGLVVLTNSPNGLALRERLNRGWLHWATESSTFALRLDRLINTLMVVIPVGVVGALGLWIARRVWK